MRLTTKVRVSNGSGGSVSGDPQIEICGMQQGVTSRSWISIMPLNKICSIAKMLISLGLRSDVFLAKDRLETRVLSDNQMKNGVSGN
jgi:hypothetical protein